MFVFILLQELGYTVVNNEALCDKSSVFYVTFISLTISLKGIIHVIGLILAFMTRKVNIEPLNDSRYSATLIYISCVLVTVAFLFFHFVEDSTIFTSVWTTLVLLEVCIYLGLTFVSKVCYYFTSIKFFTSLMYIMIRLIIIIILLVLL